MIGQTTGNSSRRALGSAGLGSSCRNSKRIVAMGRLREHPGVSLPHVVNEPLEVAFRSIWIHHARIPEFSASSCATRPSIMRSVSVLVHSVGSSSSAVEMTPIEVGSRHRDVFQSAVIWPLPSARKGHASNEMPENSLQHPCRLTENAIGPIQVSIGKLPYRRGVDGALLLLLHPHKNNATAARTTA